MAYQFQNTNTAKDAVFMVEAAAQRLRRYADVADDVVNSSVRAVDAIAALKRDGLLRLPGFFDRNRILALGEALERAIAARLPGMTVRNHRDEDLSQLNALDIRHVTLSDNADWDEAKQYTTGISLPDPLVNLPEIIELLENQKLLDVVCGYYESVPMLTFAKARVAFVNNFGAADTQHWHADPGSYRVLKLLLYLNDVGKGGGPFEYIRGSHVRKFSGWDEVTRHDEADLRKHYAADDFQACVANAGDALFAEVSGFHRGQPPVNADRRILILNFCLHEEYGLPYQRVKIRRADRDNLAGLPRAIFDELELV